MKYSTIDEMLTNIKKLMQHACEKDGTGYALPCPIMFELTNPLARFVPDQDMRDEIVRSAAESLYLLSGMNGSDFIWEFRGWEDPRKKVTVDRNALGPSLRFQGQKTENVLNYHQSNHLRQSKKGYVDQLGQAIEVLKDVGKKVVIQFASVQNNLTINSVWLHIANGKLNMLVSTGCVNDVESLSYQIISPFAFIHQIVSELTDIPLGNSQFMIGRLSTPNLTSLYPPQKGRIAIPVMDGFNYSKGKLSLKDIDTLMSIMVEFVSRLDENSLSRANPFEGDERVAMWSDYAEVFRAWKAEKLGYKIMMEQNFHHPQLRLAFKGDAL